MTHFTSIPGMVGIFLASIFSGALSSVSSTLNSLASIIWHDIMQNYALFKNFNDLKSLTVNKLLVLAIGVVCTGLAFVVATVGGNLVAISTSLNGAFSAPLIGLFLLGMFTSVCTPRGVILGAIAGFGTALWINLGAYLIRPIYPMLSLTTESCPNVSSEVSEYYSPKKPPVGVPVNDLVGFPKFYALSVFWYMPFCLAIVIVVGLVTSLVDGGLNHEINKTNEYIYFDVCSFLFCKKCRNRDDSKQRKGRRESNSTDDLEINTRF